MIVTAKSFTYYFYIRCKIIGLPCADARKFGGTIADNHKSLYFCAMQTLQLVADYYGEGIRIIENCFADHENELQHYEYVLCKGKVLKEFKLRFDHEKDFAIKTTQLGLFDLQYVKEIDFPNKTPQIGLFDFRSFLNIGMLLTDVMRSFPTSSNRYRSPLVGHQKK